MKKTRILRDLKQCKTHDFKTDSVLSYKDEKGKETGIKLPYIVTIHEESGQVLG